MKAITLWQPWSQLVAIKAKGIETRSWQTKLRGWIAIHAAKTIPREGMEVLNEWVFSNALVRAGYRDSEDLPLGCIVAFAELYDIRPTEQIIDEVFAMGHEYFFGDYSDGRFGWFLRNIIPTPEPIPMSGGQRLWNWEGGESVLNTLKPDYLSVAPIAEPPKPKQIKILYTQ